MMSWMVLCGGVLSARQPRASGREAKSRLSLQKWLLLIHFWVKEYPVKDAASDIEVDKNTAVDVYRWLREVCSTKLLSGYTNHSGRPWSDCAGGRISVQA